MGELACEFNEQYLNCHNNNDNKEEYPVYEEIREYIVLGGTNLAAIEFVENVHPDESVEDHCVYLFLVW